MAMKNIFGKGDIYLKESFPLGSNNNGLLDKVCAMFFALTPIVQHYYGLYENAGFTLYLLILPFMIMKLIKAKYLISKSLVKPVIPLLLFEVYCLIIRVTSIGRILYSAFFFLFLILLFSGYINVRLVVKYAAWIGIVATGFIVIQYGFYYVLHHPINFEPYRLLLPANSRWIVTIKYGRKLYRPSGFFLEPSHIFLYTFPIITFLLLSPNLNIWKKRVAIILSIGVVLSTSGMGIFAVVGIWALYLLTNGNVNLNAKQLTKKIFSVRTFIMFILIIVIVIIAFTEVPFFRSAVLRIFAPGDGENVSAIAGRTRRASNYVQNIEGFSSILFGTAGVNNDLDFSTSGFFATYIRWGIIGLVLSYAFYIEGVIKLKGPYYWFSILVLILSFFTAHTHGTFYMMYFAAYLANGYYINTVNKKVLMENKLSV